MISAVFKVMWLRLWRDKGALILAFVLPGFIFTIFAAIFANASGGNLDIRVALANVSAAQDAQAFSTTLKDSELITVSFDEDWTEEDIKNRVRLGQEDAGVIIFGTLSNPRAPSIKIVQDPSREVAATVLKGQIRQMLVSQSKQNTVDLFETVSALDNTDISTLKDPSITYYIGATAILFLLFSAMQGASISIDERRNGLSDRLMVGPSGAFGMLSGKFVFLTLIGFVQAAIICAVAVIFFEVSITEKYVPIGIACLGTSVLASGLALLLASLCKTQTQMNAVSTFAVLLLSAIGGSMVPRFMMPAWLQDIGTFTPNYWSIEAFYGILARGQTIFDLLPVWCVLFGGGIFCLGLAAFLSHKLMRV